MYLQVGIVFFEQTKFLRSFREKGCRSDKKRTKGNKIYFIKTNDFFEQIFKKNERFFIERTILPNDRSL